ncbi:unnamed protein product [Cyprideis torosa]|uniref:Uncharacterized protein n=1 Tax=Cyprideis torosa TaxID=163714 RepID=A0A7R8W829_9CRUS|nr:unnamed protein product [Cyprideis torosa]CAG0888178.1 unnamed protein product [Cyprideis torosa]
MSVYKWNSTGSITLDDQECRKMEEEETRDNGAIYRGQDGEDDVVLVVKPSENNTSDVNFLPKFTKNRRPARYKSSVQHLIPVRKKAEDPGIFPIQSAGLCSYLSTSWLTGLMWKGYRQGLVVKDIWRLPRRVTKQRLSG